MTGRIRKEPAVRFRVIIDASRCKACNLCIVHCPRKLLALGTELNVLGYKPVVFRDDGSCTGCGDCYRMCPECIIRIERA
jgi:NAD-dependent dihydropyrimidine dehydrogenase PreA subunit